MTVNTASMILYAPWTYYIQVADEKRLRPTKEREHLSIKPCSSSNCPCLDGLDRTGINLQTYKEYCLPHLQVCGVPLSLVYQE